MVSLLLFYPPLLKLHENGSASPGGFNAAPSTTSQLILDSEAGMYATVPAPASLNQRTAAEFCILVFPGQQNHEANPNYLHFKCTGTCIAFHSLPGLGKKVVATIKDGSIVYIPILANLNHTFQDRQIW